MNYAKLAIALLTGVLWMPLALGGTKGFTVVFMNIGDSKFYDSNVYSAFTNGFPDSQKRRDCWEGHATGGKSFEWIFKKMLPEGLTPEMAKGVYDGQPEATKKAQAILAKWKTPEGKALDGMYVINAEKGLISVMALGSRSTLGPKNPSRKVVVPWKETLAKEGAAEFDLALCLASKPLDFGFNP